MVLVGAPGSDGLQTSLQPDAGPAATAGVHNIVWAYSFNYQTYSADPLPTIPWRVDIGGIDTYDPEPGRFPNNPDFAEGEAPHRLDVNGYNGVAASIPRMAFTESGPHGSLDGNWNPATISKVARTVPNKPAWTMLWYDGFNPDNKFTGRKSIASLNGGVAWFDSCRNALCYVG